MRAFILLFVLSFHLDLAAATEKKGVSSVQQVNTRETVKLIPPPTLEQPKEPVLIPDLGADK